MPLFESSLFLCSRGGLAENFLDLVSSVTDKNSANKVFSRLQYDEGTYPRELLVLFGETCLKAGAVTTASSAFDMYISGQPPPSRDQYLIRAHFGVGEIISLDGQTLKGDVCPALLELLSLVSGADTPRPRGRI